MNDQNDSQLLRAYAEHRSESAFAELVRRHVDLVYSAARRMVCDAHLAEDVTQAVFVALAQNARPLTDRPVLSGWLHRTAQNIAAQTVRTEVRRHAREQEAAAMNELLSTAPDASWEHIAPHLDTALGELNEPDRDALLLRYFERKSAQEMAQILGISDVAAQKRVSRAVDRLREFFSKRGVAVGAGGIVLVITANAVQAAPAGLAATISAAALLAETTLATTATATATKAIAMTTLQKTLITATIAAAVGAGIYGVRQASMLRTQVQTLRQQQAPLTEQIQKLQRERDDTAKGLAAVNEENARLRSNSPESELLKLRGEVGVLRRNSTQTNDPVLQAAMAWLAKKEKLQRAFEESPDQRIPEMQFLTDEDWLSLVKDLKLDTDDDVRFAMHYVRSSAKMNSTPMIQTALKKFMEANNGNWPEDVAQLKPFFDQPIDDAILQRYKILDKEQTWSGWLNGMILVEKESVDRYAERQIAIGPAKWEYAPLPDPVRLSLPQELIPVMKSFQSANSERTPFQKPEDFNKLAPYVTTPEQKAALDHMIKTLKDAGAP